jgi:hypothetical protein
MYPGRGTRARLNYALFQGDMLSAVHYTTEWSLYREQGNAVFVERIESYRKRQLICLQRVCLEPKAGLYNPKSRIRILAPSECRRQGCQYCLAICFTYQFIDASHFTSSVVAVVVTAQLVSGGIPFAENITPASASDDTTQRRAKK